MDDELTEVELPEQPCPGCMGAGVIATGEDLDGDGIIDAVPCTDCEVPDVD